MGDEYGPGSNSPFIEMGQYVRTHTKGIGITSPSRDNAMESKI
ncbi:uncharacterized protein G2W53_007219 [Senna tora]|uniref:Uncharacterized protein n=1 Tax=Senna tora TaxID=362788 RepID=A0A834X6J5_9FABA|nr:uncharacterized protein G2W53_007219 [Senna tora]